MDVSEIPDANKGGNCFQVAFELMTELGDSSDALLVHGVCIGRGAIAGIQFVHAWVEMNGLALDDTVGATLPIERFYELGQVSVTYKYTYRQMLEKATDSGTYGPWEDDLLSDRYASRHMSGVSVPVFSDEWDSTTEGELTRYSCSVGGLDAWILGRYDGYDFYCDSYGLGDRRVVVKRSVTSFCDIPKAMNGNSWDAESDMWKGELMMGRKRASSRVRAGYDELEEYLRKNRFVTSQDAIDYYIAPALGGYSGDYDLDGIFDAAFEYVDGAYQPIEAIAEESLDGIDDTWLDIVMSNELVTTASRRASGRFAQFEKGELMMGRKRASSRVRAGYDELEEYLRKNRFVTSQDAIDYYIAPALGGYSGDYDLDGIFDAAFEYVDGAYQPIEAIAEESLDGIDDTWLDIVMSNELVTTASRHANKRRFVSKQQVWRCDEDGCKGTFSLDELRDIYDREIEHDDDAPDGAGFSHFEDWLHEMERTGVYVREGRRSRKTSTRKVAQETHTIIIREHRGMKRRKSSFGIKASDGWNAIGLNDVAYEKVVADNKLDFNDTSYNDIVVDVIHINDGYAVVCCELSGLIFPIWLGDNGEWSQTISSDSASLFEDADAAMSAADSGMSSLIGLLEHLIDKYPNTGTALDGMTISASRKAKGALRKKASRKGLRNASKKASAYRRIKASASSHVDEIIDVFESDAPYADEDEARAALDDCIDNELIYSDDVFDIARDYVEDQTLIDMFIEEFTDDVYSAVDDLSAYVKQNEEAARHRPSSRGAHRHISKRDIKNTAREALRSASKRRRASKKIAQGYDEDDDNRNFLGQLRDDLEEAGYNVVTFEEEGVLTNNLGLIIDGRQFEWLGSF